VVPWAAAAIVIFYVDATIRIVAKLSEVTPIKMEVIGDNITKLVLKVKGFPLGSYKYHAGSYIWISCNLRKKVAEGSSSSPYSPVSPAEVPPPSNAVIPKDKGEVELGEISQSRAISTASDADLEGIFSNIKVPGGPPSGLPSWIWFHPITVSSYNAERNEITVFIKSFGEGKTEWSGQLLAAAKLVQSGQLSMNDIGFHVGGPNGSLMIKEPLETLPRVILISGGIGCTPMCALLEELLEHNYSGILDFIWSTRSSAELEAFRPLFERATGKESKIRIAVHYTGKESVVATTGYKILSGRPKLEELNIADGETTALLCCGPDALMNGAEAFVVDQQRAGKSVLFHRETFEF
jgi:NAD(P)H-flavin reductase